MIFGSGKILLPLKVMITLGNNILILDGAMGTMIQKYGLTEGDCRCGPFSECVKELKGNNECLNLEEEAKH